MEPRPRDRRDFFHAQARTKEAESGAALDRLIVALPSRQGVRS
jgi:hypothetical protein